MKAALGHRRSTGGGGTTFLTLTSWARPTSLATTPAGNQKPFTTWSQFTSLLSGAVAGDYIYYNGTGVLNVTSSSGNAGSISKNVTGGSVSIDFGCSKNIWDATQITANYVAFNYTGTSNLGGLFISNSSNLNIYGGDYTSGNGGILFYGTTDSVQFLDFTSHDVGGHGIQITPVNGDITNCTFRGEVYNFAQNPSLDDHSDKGTGEHCCLIENTGASTHNYNNVKVAIYGHDSLQPGTTNSHGTWPEGGGGSCIEMGSSRSTAVLQNMTLYAKCANLNMEPGNGTNPGSTGVQTGGNCINLWGTQHYTSSTIGWAEASNISGAVIHCASGNWSSVNPSMTVNHGRHSSTNLWTSGGNAAPNNVPYPSGFNISYSDCT